jgi:hypothetical protein
MDNGEGKAENATLSRGSLLVPADIGSVYRGGLMKRMDTADLVGNAAAIDQLINNHNEQVLRRTEAERRLQDKESEVEFLKASPFVGVLMLAVSCCGVVVCSIGVNLLTSTPPPPHASLLTYVGSALVFLSGLGNVTYPYARRFFNKPRARSVGTSP